MLCPKYCSELETEDLETVRLDVTSQVVSDDWFMVREINESNEEQETTPSAAEISDFGDIYSVRDLLGVGAFGVVLLVKNRNSGEKSALKIINKNALSSRAL